MSLCSPGLVAWVDVKKQKKEVKFKKSLGRRHEMGDILNFVLSAGGILLIVGLMLYWVLHTRWGKSIPGIWWFVVSTVLFLAILWPLAIQWGFVGAKRSAEAWNAGLADYNASGYGQPVVSSADIENAKNSVVALLGLADGSTTSDGNTNTYINGGQNDVVDDGSVTTTTWRVKPDAMATLVRRLKILAGGTFAPDNSPGFSLASFPAGAEIGITCVHCLPTEVDEEWVIAIAPVESDVDPIRLEVNGKIARNLGVKVDSGSGKITRAVGTGDWAVICPDCVEKVSTSQPQPQSTQSDQSQLATPTTMTDQTDAAANEYRIVDSDGGGAFWYTPVAGSCEGVSHSKSGVIPFGTKVVLINGNAGTGWVSYMGSNTLALVDFGGQKCVFKGTLGK